MKLKQLLILLIPILVIACGPSSADPVPVSELPDPAIYALKLTEMPEVGIAWQTTQNQTEIEQGYIWSYNGYQAYMPGNLGWELDTGFAVHNDVVLYEMNVSREKLPGPPESFGDIQNISWTSAPQPQRLGDKSAVWKTTIGELFTPIWWLEFYQGHAYVRIGLLGFPDQIAPALIYGMGDIVASRLPRSVDGLRADAATVMPTMVMPTMLPTYTPMPPPTTASSPEAGQVPAVGSPGWLIPVGYEAPAGETGMVSYVDDSGSQLVDGQTGTDDILADNGMGTAYEWVGWTEATQPVTLTFTFDGAVSISAVTIGLNHRDGLGIFVPQEVSINGESFELEADQVGNNQRGEVTLTGPFNGPVVQIVLHHRGRGWILIDEVRFMPEE